MLASSTRVPRVKIWHISRAQMLFLLPLSSLRCAAAMPVRVLRMKPTLRPCEKQCNYKRQRRTLWSPYPFPFAPRGRLCSPIAQGHCTHSEQHLCLKIERTYLAYFLKERSGTPARA